MVRPRVVAGGWVVAGGRVVAGGWVVRIRMVAGGRVVAARWVDLGRVTAAGADEAGRVEAAVAVVRVRRRACERGAGRRVPRRVAVGDGVVAGADRSGLDAALGAPAVGAGMPSTMLPCANVVPARPRTTTGPSLEAGGCSVCASAR